MSGHVYIYTVSNIDFTDFGLAYLLPSQFGLPKQSLNIYLSIISCTSLLPPISLWSSLDIKIDYLILFVFFLYFMSRIAVHQLMTIFSLMVMLGSILFLFHEVVHPPLLWMSLGFHWFTIFFSIGEAMIFSNLIMEQFCLVFGGLLVTQCGLYYLYQDRISPIVFPGLGSIGYILDRFLFFNFVKRMSAMDFIHTEKIGGLHIG